MRLITAVLLLIGLVILATLLARSDLQTVWLQLQAVGMAGITVILVLRALVVAADSYSWQLTLPSVGLGPAWFGRLWNVKLIGEALNKLLPLASMGGEPVKVALLVRRFGVDLRAATTSVVLWQTINSLSLVLFVATGFVAMFIAGSLDAAYRTAAAGGLVAFALGIALFIVVQRKRITSRLVGPLARRFGPRTLAFLSAIEDIEGRLEQFYRRNGQRFAVAFLLSLATWVISAIEIHLALAFMGQPVTWIESLVIAAVTVLVRTALFLVPAGLGTQEGALVLVCSAITGVPEVGLAVAAVLRLRELVWIAVGLAVGWAYAAFPLVGPAAPEDRDRPG